MTEPDDEAARLVRELCALDLQQWPGHSALQLKKRQVLFEKLMKLWRPQLWSFVRRRSPDAFLAEDVLQTVLQRAWEQDWSQLVEPWRYCLRMGKHACVDCYRHHAKVVTAEDIQSLLDQSTAHDEDPDVQADLQRILELVRCTDPDVHELLLGVAKHQSLRQYAQDSQQNHQTLSQRRCRWLLRHAHRLRDYLTR